MPVRMLVTDLDNTLLRSDKSISEYTASVFRRCREKGMKIVFATLTEYDPNGVPKISIEENLL